jgi:hypothetical protein
MMNATEFELPGELEDELEEEAELEPLFPRGKPIPVPRPAPNAVYRGDLEDEFEDEAAELEPFFPRRSDLEFETLTPMPRPAPNAVDPDAAEPVFSGRVRTPDAPLLDAATLILSSRFNQATHPKVSGLTLADLRARLERYIDRATLDDLVRRANAGAATPIDEATLVTLLAHQFQRKTCRTPTVGDITKRCTVNGRVAEDTLDALGFVYHAGATLNTADQVNTVAATTLRRVPASAIAGIEPALTAKTWWSYMVSPPWLGLPIKQGIHLVLLKRLRRAQHALMNLPAYANLSPAELGKALGLEEEHKGARPGTADWSMHLFGLAIDIGFTRNPWLSNPRRDTAKLEAITLRAARLVGPSGAGDQGITARFLHDLAITFRDTGKIHRIIADRSMWLGEYFALAGDAKRLQSLLPLANVIFPADPAAPWFKPGESQAAAAARWTRVIRTDFNDFANAVSRGDKKNEVRHGFMDLARDLVIALRDEACLGWGAVDFGPAASGDVMHFDCRVDGIGRTIAKTSGKPFVPDSGHPCIPAGGAPPTQREFERPAWARRRVQAKKAPGPQRTPPNVPARSLCSAASALAGNWQTIKIDKDFPLYADGQSTDYAVNVPDVLASKEQIDLLVFFHGLNIADCQPCFDPDPTNRLKKFGLDAQVNNPKRPVVLAVPRLFWKEGDNGANVARIWTAANFNKFVESVLKAIGLPLVSVGAPQFLPRKLGSLIIAGHSRAYAILTPLAREFNKSTAATKAPEHLSKLTEVWAMDTTYSTDDVDALEAWAKAMPKACFLILYNKAGKEQIQWKDYYTSPSHKSGPSANLRMCIVPERHCEIPAKYVGELLSDMKCPPDWFNTKCVKDP